MMDQDKACPLQPVTQHLMPDMDGTWVFQGIVGSCAWIVCLQEWHAKHDSRNRK